METYILKQDYFFAVNHKLYRKNESVKGKIHRDKEFLEVLTQVNCYSCNNTFEPFIEYLPMDILEKKGE